MLHLGYRFGMPYPTDNRYWPIYVAIIYVAIIYVATIYVATIYVATLADVRWRGVSR